MAAPLPLYGCSYRVIWLLLSCDMAAPILWYGYSYPVIWLHLSCDMAAPILWYGCSYPVIWLLLSCDMATPIVWYGCTYPMIWLLLSCDMTALIRYLSTKLYFVTFLKTQIVMIANMWVSDRILFLYADVISVLGTSRRSSDSCHLIREYEQCVSWGLYGLLVEDERLGCDARWG